MIVLENVDSLIVTMAEYYRIYHISRAIRDSFVIIRNIDLPAKNKNRFFHMTQNNYWQKVSTTLGDLFSRKSENK